MPANQLWAYFYRPSRTEEKQMDYDWEEIKTGNRSDVGCEGGRGIARTPNFLTQASS